MRTRRAIRFASIPISSRQGACWKVSFLTGGCGSEPRNHSGCHQQLSLLEAWRQENEAASIYTIGSVRCKQCSSRHSHEENFCNWHHVKVLLVVHRPKKPRCHVWFAQRFAPRFQNYVTYAWKRPKGRIRKKCFSSKAKFPERIYTQNIIFFDSKLPGWPSGSGGGLQTRYTWVQILPPAPSMRVKSDLVVPFVLQLLFYRMWGIRRFTQRQGNIGRTQASPIIAFWHIISLEIKY